LREILAILSIVVLMLPIFFIPDARVVDSTIIDAALAENSAWMECEIALPRYLSFIRCLIDRWLVENYGRDVDEVRLPITLETDEWKTYAENEARNRGVELTSNLTPVRLGMFLWANESQNRVFAGKCREGAIGVRGFMSILVISRRGFAEATARRNYSISVCHPCIYFLIKKAHEDVEIGLENIFPKEVVVVGTSTSYAGAVSLLKARFLRFDEEVNEFLTSKRREYSPRGAIIKSSVKKKVLTSRKGNIVELHAIYRFHIEVWDREVLYWAGNLRKGWYLKNDLKFELRMSCRIIEMEGDITLPARSEGDVSPKGNEGGREIEWLKGAR